MTTLDLIGRLDDGLTVSDADLALLEIAERHASDYWHRHNERVEAYRADVCYCGEPAVGGECVGCHNDVERAVVRAGDL